MDSSTRDPLKQLTTSIVQAASWKGRVGASSLGMACSRCLAGALSGWEDLDRPAGFAAWIGTAVHHHLELHVKEHHPEWQAEQRVVVGEVPHYGQINGVVDLYMPDHEHIVDYKCVGAKKIAPYTRCHSRGNYNTRDGVTLHQYVRQLMLCGKGIEDAGGKVRNVTLRLIPVDERTGNLIDSFFDLTWQYDRSVAEETLERAARVTEWLQTPGANLDDVESAKGCYTCEQVRPYILPQVGKETD